MRRTERFLWSGVGFFGSFLFLFFSSGVEKKGEIRNGVGFLVVANSGVMMPIVIGVEFVCFESIVLVSLATIFGGCV